MRELIFKKKLSQKCLVIANTGNALSNEGVGVHLVGSQRQLSELKISPTFPGQVYLQLKKVQCRGVEKEDGRRCR